MMRSKRLILPKRAFSVQQLVNVSCGYAFDPFHDFGEKEWLASAALQWRKEEMDMVRHDHCGMHFDLSVVLEQTVLQSNGSSWWRKEYVKGPEGDEVCRMEFLDVWQVASVTPLQASSQSLERSKFDQTN
jgi:hypothetical protein